MPHLNLAGIDLVVSMFVVRDDRVLLVDHRKLGGWFPPGGHVELTRANSDGTYGEDCLQAVYRELEEETGLTWLDVSLFARRPDNSVITLLPRGRLRECHNARYLPVPWQMDLHDFPPEAGHRHLALVYLLAARTDEVKLEAAAHKAVRWFSVEDLLATPMLATIRAYGVAAIRTVSLSALAAGSFSRPSTEDPRK